MAVWWAVGALVVVGLYVYEKGKAAAPAMSQVPTSIAPTLAPSGAGMGGSSGGGGGGSDTFPQGGSGSDTSSSDYQPAAATASVGSASFGYSGGLPAYSNPVALSIIPGTPTGQSSGPPLLNPGGFAANPGGGYNPGGGLVLAK